MWLSNLLKSIRGDCPSYVSRNPVPPPSPALPDKQLSCYLLGVCKSIREEPGKWFATTVGWSCAFENRDIKVGYSSCGNCLYRSELSPDSWGAIYLEHQDLDNRSKRYLHDHVMRFIELPYRVARAKEQQEAIDGVTKYFRDLGCPPKE